MKIEDEIMQYSFESEYHKLIINILYTSKWFEQKNAELLKPFKISGQQFNILRILRGQHPKCATMSTLQERMLDKMSNASRLVEKLRLKGLVDRRENPEDRRLVSVTITEKGLKLLKELDVIMTNKPEIDSKLTQQETEVMNNLLDRIRS
jgi:DNA-binding MarR family transcriptional regulator